MSLRALLGAVAVSATDDNIKDITTLIRGLGHAEYIVSNNAFIVKHINNLSDPLLREIFTDINKLLIKEVDNDVTKYVSGNACYEEIQDFMKNGEQLKAEFYLEALVQGRARAEEQEEKLPDEITLNPENITIEEAIRIYTACRSNFNLWGKYVDRLQRMPTTNPELKALQEEVHESKLRILKLRYIALMTMATIYLKRHLGEDKQYYQTLSQFVKESEKDFVSYSLQYKLDRNKLEDIQVHLDVTNNLMTKIQVRKQKKLNVPSNKPTVFSFYTNDNDGNPATEHSQFQISPVLFPIKELDKDFYYRIAKKDQWMYTKIALDLKSLNEDLLHNIDFLLGNGQFELGAKALKAKNKYTEILSDSTTAQHDMEASLEIIGRFIGSGKTDQIFWREFNFLHYTGKTIEKLNKLSSADLLKKPSVHNLLHSILEVIVIKFWLAAHDCYINVFPGMAANGVYLTAFEHAYYSLLTKQKYLKLAAGFLAEMHRLRMYSWQQSSSNEYIRQYVSPDIFDQYIQRFGTDGFHDILLYKIGEFEVALQASLFYLPPTEPAIENPREAERHYLELMAQLENEEKQKGEEKEVSISPEEELKKKKKAYKDKTDKKKPSKLAFFQLEKSDKPLVTDVIPLTKEEKLYQDAIKARKESPTLQPAISIYEEIVTAYLLNKPTPNESKDQESSGKPAPDYFFIAAALTELADCYILKGMEMTQSNFCKYSVESNPITSIKANYKQALHYAQLADECYKEYVAELPEHTQKKFENLADSIRIILDSATDLLQYMRSKVGSAISKLERKRELQARSRAIAYAERGPEKWTNNPNAKHFYAELREKNTAELEFMQCAAEDLSELVEEGMIPLTNNFSYLTGNSPIPLLMPPKERSKKSQHKIKSEDALEGGGVFNERLKLLATYNNLLKEGKDRDEIRLALMPPKPEGGTDTEVKLLTDSSPILSLNS